MLTSVPHFFDDLHGVLWFNRNISCALRVCFIQASLWQQPMEAQGSESSDPNLFVTEFAPVIGSPQPVPPHPLFSLTWFGFRLLLLVEMLGVGGGGCSF